MIQQVQNRVIDSVDEMAVLLFELRDQASAYIQEIINAQMIVLKYVRSSKLVDTTFDSLAFTLKKAIKFADSQEMAIRIQDQSSLMIQNYILFLDARLEYVLNDHKKEAEQLLGEAGDMLASSIVKVAELSVDGGANFGDNIAVQNVFQSGSSSGKSFFSKVMNRPVEKSNIEVDRVESYKMLGSLFERMARHQNLIGQSLLVAELVRRYTPDVIVYSEDRQTLLNVCACEIATKARSKSWMGSIMIGSIGVGFFVFGGILTMVSINFDEDIVLELSDLRFLVLYLGFIATICLLNKLGTWFRCRQILKRCSKQTKQLEKRIAEHTETLNSIAQQFENYDNSLESV